jgi:hypothetical protein
MGKNKNQHYVSAFYLYNFTSTEQRVESKGKEKRNTKIHHFDVAKGSMKERPIEKVAVESYMLSFRKEGGSYDHSLDDELYAAEVKASKAIDELSEILEHLIKTKSKSVEIDDSLMESIVEFMCWQIRRHPDIVNDITGECRSYLEETGKKSDQAKEMALSVVKNIGQSDEPYDLFQELQKKNKVIVFTTSPDAQFVTSDYPFVRFNKNDKDGISIEGTEMYFPITSNMLLFMCGDGNRREFRIENDRVFLRGVNSYIARNAKRYIFGKSDAYIKRLVKNNSPRLHKYLLEPV